MINEKVPKTIYICAKVRDGFGMSVMDANNNRIAEYGGYVPSYIPSSYGDYIKMEFEIETGRIFNWKNPIGNSKFNEILKDAGNKVPKTIFIGGKCSDMFSMSVMDANDICLVNYSGYVPSFIPGSYGDYVEMDIDLETGIILNWKNPTGTPKFNAILEGREENDGDDEDDEEEEEEFIEILNKKVPERIYISANCSERFYMSVEDVNEGQIASYNGYVPSFIPNKDGYYIQMDINIETGRILNWRNPTGNSKFNAILQNAGRKVPKTISISGKCSDMFYMSIKDENNHQMASYNGNVPQFIMNGDGDYIQMNIDIETGEILNWINPLGDNMFQPLLEEGAEAIELE